MSLPWAVAEHRGGPGLAESTPACRLGRRVVLVAGPGSHPHTRAARKQRPALEAWVALDRDSAGPRARASCSGQDKPLPGVLHGLCPP